MMTWRELNRLIQDAADLFRKSVATLAFPEGVRENVPVHKALYGSVGLNRGKCPSCKAVSLVVDGEYACCGSPAERPIALKRKRMAGGEKRPKRPSAARRREILDEQGYCCFYCRTPFGEILERHGRPETARLARPVFDHLLPFSLTRTNEPGNFVAACSVCNGIKGSLVFETVEDAREYVYGRWLRKGWAVV